MIVHVSKAIGDTCEWCGNHIPARKTHCETGHFEDGVWQTDHVYCSDKCRKEDGK